VEQYYTGYSFSLDLQDTPKPSISQLPSSSLLRNGCSKSR
jgi:hypothetical protein